MRAVLLDEPAPIERHPLRVADVDVPKPAADEVRIKVQACGVCRTDLHVVEGDLVARRAPIIPGHQVVGTIESLGASVTDHQIGARVGVAWLHSTCGCCPFCASQRENLCDSPEFTGWTVHGGFAEYLVAPASFTYPLPDGFSDLQAAPLLCAGIIGFRALRLTGLLESGLGGRRLGIYGFGAAAHIIAQVAVAQGRRVFAFTRPGDEEAQRFARALGAEWAGSSDETPPVELESAIIFAPVGALVPRALACLRKGGTVVCGGIHMSDIPAFPYDLLWGERVVRSVANLTREDARGFMELAPRLGVKTHVTPYPLEEANKALDDLRRGALKGAAVLIP